MLTIALLCFFADSADSFLLIIAVGDAVIDRNVHQIELFGAAVHQLLQIALAEDGADLALCSGQLVLKISFKAVGGEDHRPAAKLVFQTVGIEGCRLVAGVGVSAGALCLHYGKRQTVPAKQDIVAVAHLSGDSRHALDRVFLEHVSIGTVKLPAHLLHVHINIDLSGLIFREVLRLKGTFLLVLFLLCRILCRHLLNLSAQCFDLSVLLVQQALLFLNLFGVDYHLFGRNQRFIKGAFNIIFPVAIVNPLDKFEQAAQRYQCITLLHAAFGMYGKVSKLDDKRDFSPGVVVHRKAERRFVNQRLQVVLIGHLHGVICRVDPLHRQFQRLAAAHRTHGRSRSVDCLGFDAGRGKEGIFGFGLEEGEVSHRRSPHLISVVLPDESIGKYRENIYQYRNL